MAAPVLTLEDARERNAGIVYSSRPNHPARPFVLSASALDREQAVTCLATAVWYEAGDDTVGERAVAQVVLNRTRHPAFPKSVCGVVFQGSERRTGCQFTFTCDGALARKPSGAAWKRARAVAAEALAGFVYAPVGTATHYHTDWVVPYWAATLDKITMVHTHIFYRWNGWWGEPAAFSGRYQGAERIDPRIAGLSDDPAIALHAAPTLPLPGEALVPPSADAGPQVPGVSRGDLRGNRVHLADVERGAFVLQLNPEADPATWAVTALALCRGRTNCVVMGWTKPSYIPARLPVMASNMQTTAFLYRRSMAAGADRAWWNCKQFPRKDSSQCRPGTEPTLS